MDEFRDVFRTLLRVFEDEFRFDVLVEGGLLVELNAVQEVHPVHKGTLLSYRKSLEVP